MTPTWRIILVLVTSWPVMVKSVMVKNDTYAPFTRLLPLCRFPSFEAVPTVTWLACWGRCWPSASTAPPSALWRGKTVLNQTHTTPDTLMRSGLHVFRNTSRSACVRGALSYQLMDCCVLFLFFSVHFLSLKLFNTVTMLGCQIDMHCNS